MRFRKNILIVATQPQRFLDQIFFARNITEKTDEVKIYFFINDETYSLYGDIVDTLEFRIINNFQKIQVKALDRSFLKDLLKSRLTLKQRQKIRHYIDILKNTKFFTYKLQKDENVFFDDLIQKYNYIYKLVKDYDIDLLLINGDRHLGVEPAFLKVAQKLKIPTIIPYMVYFAEEEGLTKTSMIKTTCSVFTSNYIRESEIFLVSHKSRNKYYYPHTVANALHKFGVLTQNPWFMGGGWSDIICLPNENMKNHYVENGINQSKIRILGDVSNDQLYKQYKNRNHIKQKMLKKYTLERNKKTVIITLPQLGEHNILSWDKHWEEINYLMKSLDELNQNILISLHPKMDRKKYKFLEENYNCKILDERLIDVLPIADMFVATFSSTVLWSVLCGIKTVLVDFYGLNYTMYDFLSSIKKVDNKENLGTILKSILHKSIDFSQDWKSLSRDEVFDGMTIERYISLITAFGVQKE